MRERTGAGEVQLEKLERIKPKTLMIILASTLAFYTLLPQLADLDDTADTFGSAEVPWLLAALVASAVSYVFATISFVGSVADAVPYVPALRSRLASSFTALVGPASTGVIGFSVRFLERSGVSVVNATGGVALNTLAGFLVHLTLMLGFILWTGRSGVGNFSFPEANTLLLVGSVLLAAFGAASLFRPFRKRVLQPAIRSAIGAASSMGQVFKSPSRVLALFGGAAGVTLTYIVALACSVEAFGGSLSFPQIGTAFLVAMTIATFAPTPGGLGAVEAALIAGLTGFGLPGRCRRVVGAGVPAGDVLAADPAGLGDLHVDATERRALTRVSRHSLAPRRRRPSAIGPSHRRCSGLAAAQPAELDRLPPARCSLADRSDGGRSCRAGRLLCWRALTLDSLRALAAAGGGVRGRAGAAPTSTSMGATSTPRPSMSGLSTTASRSRVCGSSTRPGDGRRIGRVVTAKPWRGGGLAGDLMSRAMALIGEEPIVLNAQAHLEEWYGRLGFVRNGQPFDDDGIAHVPMRRG